MWKKGKMRGSFKRRYVRLVGATLSYSEGPSMAAKVKGYIDLSNAFSLRAAVDPSKYRKAGGFFMFALEVDVDRRTWVLIPESVQDRDAWVDAFVAALRPDQVSPSLLTASHARTDVEAPAPPVAAPSRRLFSRKEESKQTFSSPASSSDEGEGASASASGPGAGAAAPKSSFFGRNKQPQSLEMTTPSPGEMALRTELERLKQENQDLRVQISRAEKAGGKGKGKPLLGADGDAASDDDSDDDGPGCCTRCCDSIKKNIAMLILLAINLVILVRGRGWPAPRRGPFPGTVPWWWSTRKWVGCTSAPARVVALCCRGAVPFVVRICKSGSRCGGACVAAGVAMHGVGDRSPTDNRLCLHGAIFAHAHTPTPTPPSACRVSAPRWLLLVFGSCKTSRTATTSWRSTSCWALVAPSPSWLS